MTSSLQLLSVTCDLSRGFQDGSFPESLPTRLSENNLYDIGTFLHRDVVQTLYRFAQQLGKFDAYLKYVCNGTKEHFRPKGFLQDIVNLTYNVNELRRRLEVCKDHANMSLTLVVHYSLVTFGMLTRKLDKQLYLPPASAACKPAGTDCSPHGSNSTGRLSER